MPKLFKLELDDWLDLLGGILHRPRWRLRLSPVEALRSPAALVARRQRNVWYFGGRYQTPDD